jgi:hypothetical protein
MFMSEWNTRYFRWTDAMASSEKIRTKLSTGMAAAVG